MSRCRPLKNISAVKSGCGTVNDIIGIEPGP
jgi:hypothetical protein